MKGAYPKLTIVTPSLNQGCYLERAIKSVLSQGYPNLEYFVLDGGSNDSTTDVLQRYDKQLSWWCSAPDGGQCQAINRGFSMGRGDYFSWLGADDYFLPGAFYSLAEHMVPGKIALVGGGVSEPALRVLPSPREVSFASLCRGFQGGFFSQPSCFFSASAWEASGGLDEATPIALDVDLWFKMLRSGVQFRSVDLPLSGTVRQPAAKTVAYPHLLRLDCGLVQAAHGCPGGLHAAKQALLKCPRDMRTPRGRLLAEPIIRRAVEAGLDWPPLGRFR